MSNAATICLGTKSSKEKVRCIEQNDSKIFTEYSGNVCWKPINDDKILIFISDDASRDLNDPKSLDVTRFHVIDKKATRDTTHQYRGIEQEAIILTDEEFLSAVRTLFPEPYIKEPLIDVPENLETEQQVEVSRVSRLSQKPKDSGNSAAMCIFLLFVICIVTVVWYRNSE